MALAVFFFLSDFPEEAKWLKPDEKAFIIARLRADQGNSARDAKVTLKGVGSILSEFRVLIAGVMYFGLIVPAYSYAYFSPTIIKSFGYTPIQTQLHSVPPWAAASGWSMLDASATLSVFSNSSTRRGLAGPGAPRSGGPSATCVLRGRTWWAERMHARTAYE